MKIAFKTIIQLMFVILFSCEVYALSIVSPKEGQVVYQEDRLTVVVKSDVGEEWEEVVIESIPMSYNFLTKEYKAVIEIPRNDKAGIISFFVAAYDKTKKEHLVRRSLFVKLPPNVVLKGIELDDYEVIYKLPMGSTVQNAKDIETMKLNVKGLYSDNVKRKVTSSIMGTTYTSSDAKIVTVDKEGKVTAQGLGKAKITVRNGKFSAAVDVVVKPYKK